MQEISQSLEFLLVAKFGCPNMISKRNETPQPHNALRTINIGPSISFLFLIFRLHLSILEMKLKSVRAVCWAWGFRTPTPDKNDFRQDCVPCDLRWLHRRGAMTMINFEQIMHSKIMYALLLELGCINQWSPHQQTRGREGPHSPGIIELQIWISRLDETSSPASQDTGVAWYA